MMWPTMKRSDPDKGFTSVRNLHSAALADGDVVAWLCGDDTPPTGYTANYGVDVKVATAAGLRGAGVISNPQGGSCAQGDYCLCQVYGMHPNVRTTAAALAVGSTINTDAALAAVAGVIGDDPSSRIGFSMVVGAGNRARCFLKCM